VGGDGCYRTTSINSSIYFVVNGSQFLYPKNYTYHLYNQCSYHPIIYSLEHIINKNCTGISFWVYRYIAHEFMIPNLQIQVHDMLNKCSADLADSCGNWRN
jgi:hypothetical protein